MLPISFAGAKGYGPIKRNKTVRCAKLNTLQPYHSKIVYDFEGHRNHFEESRIHVLSVGGDLLGDFAHWMEDNERLYREEFPPSEERNKLLSYIAKAINEAYLQLFQERANATLPEFLPFVGSPECSSLQRC